MEIQFCPYCGAKLYKNAQFCNSCGKAILDDLCETEKSERKTVYDGNIHKCPNCGEVLNAFSSNCPSCGYEIRGASNSDAIRIFSDRFTSASTWQEKEAIIRNFPIPNTKEDIWEFMILASTNIFDESVSKVNKAWKTKFEQSFQKAKLIFEENDLAKIQMLYDNTIKKIKIQSFASGAKLTGSAVIKSGSIFSKLLNALLRNLLCILSIFAFCEAIRIDRINENGTGFELLGDIFLITSALLILKKNTSYIDLAFVIGTGILTLNLSKFLENGSGLQLFGAVTLIITFIGFIKKAIKSNSVKGE